jgi:GT2 family glycosyltransferase
MKSCSVIIVNYNTGELLKQSVDAILKNDKVIEVIVVDNNSFDRSMDLLEKSTILKKYFRKENYGFAASCNFGAKLAKGDTLLFLNPDCIVNDNILEKLFININDYKNTAIVGCRVNNPNGTEQRASRRRLPTFWRAFKTFSGLEKMAKQFNFFAGVNLDHLKMPDSWQYVEAISGAFIFIKTKVFDEINGFDEKYPMHFEDLDLFKRTRDIGYKIAFNPNVSVIHHQGTSSQSNPRVAEMKKQGLQRYFHKHCSRMSYFIVKLLR